MKFEHINLVRSLAWSFHRSTGIDWKELFSEACLAYCEGVRAYTPKKGAKVTTWVYWCIQSRLINFCKQEQKYQTPKEVDWYKPAMDVFHELFESDRPLSDSTKEIIEMVLQNPYRYLMLTPLKAVGRIKKDLVVKKKRRPFYAVRAMKTLREELLREIPQRTVWKTSRV